MNKATVQKAKRELWKVRLEQAELARMQRQKKKLGYDMLPSGISYDRDRIQSSPSDAFTDKMIAAAELSRKIDRQIAKLLTHKAQVMDRITRMDDPTCRILLELRYLGEDEHMYTWSEVATIMQYSEAAVFKIHDRALQMYAKARSTRNKTDSESL